VARSEGIAVVVSLGEERVETRRFLWAPWDAAPPTTEREKASLALFSQAVKQIPDPLAALTGGPPGR
jgi:hypothetical protein